MKANVARLESAVWASSHSTCEHFFSREFLLQILIRCYRCQGEANRFSCSYSFVSLLCCFSFVVVPLPGLVLSIYTTSISILFIGHALNNVWAARFSPAPRAARYKRRRTDRQRQIEKLYDSKSYILETYQLYRQTLRSFRWIFTHWYVSY